MKMKKIVINSCFGGFGLSQEALRELQKLNDKLVVERKSEVFPEESLWLSEDFDDYPHYRGNYQLIEVVEKLGSRANGDYSELYIVEIPDDVEYTIKNYDGQEWVAEVHRTWSSRPIRRLK